MYSGYILRKDRILSRPWWCLSGEDQELWVQSGKHIWIKPSLNEKVRLEDDMEEQRALVLKISIGRFPLGTGNSQCKSPAGHFRGTAGFKWVRWIIVRDEDRVVYGTRSYGSCVSHSEDFCFYSEAGPRTGFEQMSGVWLFILKITPVPISKQTGSEQG